MSSLLMCLVLLCWLALSTMVTLASAMFKDYLSVAVGSVLSILILICLVETIIYW